MNASRLLLLSLLTSIFFLADKPSHLVNAQTDRNQDHWITAIAWNSDGTLLATGYYDGLVQVISVETREIILEIEETTQPIYSVAWHPTSMLLATANYDGLIHIWNVTDGSLLHTFSSSRLGFGFGLVWSLDGSKIIAGAFEGITFYIWDVTSGELLDTRDNTGTIGEMVWHPEGTYLAIANLTGYVTILDADTFDFAAVFDLPEAPGQGGDVYSVAWHPSGNVIASGSLNGKIRLWNVENGEIINEFRGNEASEMGFYETAIRSMHFSPDGNLLTSVSADGTIRTWNLSTGKSISDISTETLISAAAWNGDGSQLVYGVNTSQRANPDADENLYVILSACEIIPCQD